MRLLVTRPREDARPLADALAELGVEAVTEPLLTIHRRPEAARELEAAGLDEARGLLVTSANGVRAFAETSARRDLTVYAVGDASARAARAAGFDDVHSAGGDVADLAALVRRRADPGDGPLVHVAGTKVAGDLAGALAEAGFECRRAVLYAAETAEDLSRDTVAAIADGQLDGILFFSPRTATTFVSLARRAEITSALKGLTAYCLSPAVADALAPLTWGAVRTAERPEQDVLLWRIAEDLSAHDRPRDRVADGGAEEEGVMQDRSDKDDTPSEAPDVHADVHTDEVEGIAEDADAARPRDGDAAPQEDTEPADTPQPPDAERPADADAPAGEPAPQTGSGPGRGLAVALWLVAFVAVVIVAGYASRDQWAPKLAPHLPESVRETAWVRDVLGLPQVSGPPSEAPSETPAPSPASPAPAEQTPAAPPEVATPGAPAPEAPAAETSVPAGGALADLEAERDRLSSEVDRLLERVGDLETRLAEVRRMVSAVAPPDGLGADLERLSQRLAELETGGGQADLERRLSSISERLAELEQIERDDARAEARVPATVLAVGQLREALRSSAPFHAELAALREVAGDSPEVSQALETLAPLAETGVPTREALRDRFDNVAGEIVRAAAVPGDEGWVERTVRRLSSVVTVRRTEGNTAGSGTDAVVARAEARLAEGDLAGAVRALEGLEAAPAEAAAAWLGDARARLAADKALAELHGHAVGLLAGARG